MEALIASMLVSFITTFVAIPYAMKFFSAVGIVSMDLHKKNKPKLPSGGGICVGFGVLAGLLTYVGLQTFVFDGGSDIIYLLAVISTVLIVTFSGMLDDLNVKSRLMRTKDGRNIKVGLPQWIKPLMTLPAAVPLMVVSAGVTTMGIPFVGAVNFGILYPLLIIPFIVVVVSNMINLLGGFNGSEAGMGIVYTLTLGIYALFFGSLASVVFLITVPALLVFLRYNWCPAKMLPGDSLTYLLGSVVAAGLIVGNIEKIGVFVLVPFIIEFFLKSRSKLKASCLGKLRPDGKLDPPYGRRIYSLTHIIMNLRPFTERGVSLALIFMEVVVCGLVFYAYFAGLINVLI